MTISLGFVVDSRGSRGNKLRQKGSKLRQNTRRNGIVRSGSNSEVCSILRRRGSCIRDSKSRQPTIIVLEIDIKTLGFGANVREGKVLVRHVGIRVFLVGDFA